ncbi:MAG: phosphoribosyl-AMP cyclohydrolase [Methanomicrobiales archaeon]|jgi:phosphoribosyl-AMP cyclohydrolase|nr:phosphoribosyl-AMP cyclohydrolase [Burkholderiaceae bacterium]HNO07233.1 phosphoribosyl-AMP cyclohydrolase [Methanoregulaceae archaeon]HNY88413.1 phosphoribosyl-AMP cyclohydrolase [Methanoregulaceae archaeon]HOB59836.1 phosphoribosyl-AMP cyclohydrolase [Methanoregulaceae archaeon]HOW33290.1 phosphoribosyl-AMP cyclohydrolase [Methanoregulaceae archaeon]
MLDLHYTDGLIPVVVQDIMSLEVLMVAYANEEAVSLTRDTGFAHYFSRSRRKIWKKGEESGHVQKVRQILVDCDEDCLLYLVEQTGAACHTGYQTCFYRTIDDEIISERVFNPSEVYTKKAKD